LGTGARLPTVAFMGWFGPGGLASIVFALIAFESRIPDRQMLFTTVMMIILLSVFLHGLSSVPLVAAYSRWYAAHVTEHPSASGEEPTIMSRLRHHPTLEEHHPTPEETEPATAQQRPSP
jgi:sodium/hydrogen antiporter